MTSEPFQRRKCIFTVFTTSEVVNSKALIVDQDVAGIVVIENCIVVRVLVVQSRSLGIVVDLALDVLSADVELSVRFHEGYRWDVHAAYIFDRASGIN